MAWKQWASVILNLNLAAGFLAVVLMNLRDPTSPTAAFIEAGVLGWASHHHDVRAETERHLAGAMVGGRRHLCQP